MELYNPLNGQPIFGAKPEPPKKGESNQDKILRYQRELTVAARFFKDNWWVRADRHVHMYELDHFYNTMTGQTEIVDYDRIKVPYPYANARQLLAEIYTKVPEPIVKPKKTDKPSAGGFNSFTATPQQQLSGQSAPPFTPTLTIDQPADPTTGITPPPQVVDLKAGATKLKGVITHCIDESRYQAETKLATLDGIVTGLGCVMFSAQPNTKIPKYSRILYKDLLFWHGATSPYDSPWICRRVVRPVDAVKNDERYDEKIRTAVTANSQLNKELMADLPDSLGQFQYVVTWDRWDKATDTHCEWVDNGQDFLIEEKMSGVYNFAVESDEYGLDWPFAFFINEEMLSKPWGLGDVAPIEAQVHENDKVRTMQLNHIKRFQRKYIAKKDFFDEKGMKQLKDPIDGAVIETREDITDTNFQPVQDAPLSSDVYRVGELIERDIQIISPIGPNALVRGVGERPDTLGEAEIIEQNSNTRLDEKRDNVAAMHKRLFRLTAQYVQQHWVEEDVIRVTGDGMRPTDWLAYAPDEVKGEYDYDVDPESLRDNSAVYRKQLADALSIAGPVIVQANPPGMLVLVRQYLETFPNLQSQLDKILPEQLTTPPEETVTPEDTELAGLVEKMGPQAVLDSLKNLPENERQIMTQEIDKIAAQLGAGAPTSASIGSSAQRI